MDQVIESAVDKPIKKMRRPHGFKTARERFLILDGQLCECVCSDGERRVLKSYSACVTLYFTEERYWNINGRCIQDKHKFFSGFRSLSNPHNPVRVLYFKEI